MFATYIPVEKFSTHSIIYIDTFYGISCSLKRFYHLFVLVKPNVFLTSVESILGFTNIN
jgi:hypothetical protein